MDLAQHLVTLGIGYAEAARRLSAAGYACTGQAMKYWAQRRRIPRAPAMAAIVAWSGGAVTPADFYPAHSGSASDAGGADGGASDANAVRPDLITQAGDPVGMEDAA